MVALTGLSLASSSSWPDGSGDASRFLEASLRGDTAARAARTSGPAPPATNQRAWPSERERPAGEPWVAELAQREANPIVLP